MSIEAMVGALNHSRAQGAAHIVLLNIANHQGEQGAWPSIPTLARLAKVSDRRVQQILNELVELGEITIEARAAGYGSVKTNRYWVTLTCPATCDGTFAHREVKPVSDAGEVDFTAGVKPVSLGGEVDFTQTNINTKVKQNKNQSNYKEDFENFWKQYPRKEAKPKAAREFAKLANELGADYLMQQLLIWLSHPSKKDRQYWPYAERWLRDRRFDDELPVSSGVAKSNIKGWFE